MKHSFKCLLGLLLAAQSLQAQTADTIASEATKYWKWMENHSVNLPSKDTFFTTNTIFIARSHDVRVSFHSESGSSGLPLAITGRFLLGGYIPSEPIKEAEERMKQQVRGGLASTMQLNILDKFYLRRHQMGGIRFNDDAFRLVFQGNGAYMGQTLDARINKAVQWDIVELGFRFAKTVRRPNSKGNITYFGSINPGLLRSYSAVKDFRAKVFTDTLAQNVDVLWGGRVQRASGGLGLTVNFSAYVDLCKKAWHYHYLEVMNFGLYHTANLQTYSRTKGMADSTVCLQAATTSLNNIFRGDWFGDCVDTVKQQLGLDSSRRGKTILAPFELYVSGHHKKLGWLSLSYRHLPGYLPRMDWKSYSSRLMLGAVSFHPGISLGGFDTWNINLSGNWNWKPTQRGGLIVNLNLEGLESLVMPGRLNGFGALASVRVRL